MLLIEAVRRAQHRLETAGLASDDALRDASLMARVVLGWDAARWLSRQREPAPPNFEATFEHLVARRATREPVAYITGEREFYGRPFLVTRDVLIPRPETELLIEEALRVVSPLPSAHRPVPSAQGSVPVIVDVGTGSGCLAVTLALEIPDARVIATDTSEAALAIARENARQHAVLDRIEFHHTPLLLGVSAPVDVIVSNPPYVPTVDREGLSPEVRDFEPAEALFAGQEGLDTIRALVPAAARALRSGGYLLMEIGAGQADAVRALVAAAGLTGFSTREDLQGIPRVVVAQI